MQPCLLRAGEKRGGNVGGDGPRTTAAYREKSPKQ